LEVKIECPFYKERVYKILNLPDVDELILEFKEIIKEVDKL
jgi:hypothetical protein